MHEPARGQALHVDDRASEERRESRAMFELREELEHARSQLAACLGAERIRDLEFAALRRELDVQEAYNTTLERLAAERLQEIERLHACVVHLEGHLGVPAAVARTEATLVAALAQSAVDRAEQHDRLLNRLAQLDAQLDRAKDLPGAIARAELAESRAQEAEAVLAAHRSRASSRLVERATAFLHRRRLSLSAAIWLARALSGRQAR